MTGSLYRRGRVWWMAYVVDARQRCEGAGEKNRRRAQEKLNIRLAEIAQGQFNLLKKQRPASLEVAVADADRN